MIERINTVEDSPAVADSNETKRRHFITADDVLHYFTSDGVELKIPVATKTKVFKVMREMEELDGLFYMLEQFGDTHTQAIIEDMEILETMDLVETWAEAFEQRLAEAVERRQRQQGK